MVRRHQPSEVFIDVLRDLIAVGRVRLLNQGPANGSFLDMRDKEHVPVVGQVRPAEGRAGPPGGDGRRAGGALKAEARGPLACSTRALTEQLLNDGLVLDKTGSPMAPNEGGPRTYQARFLNGRATVIRVKSQALFGDPEAALPLVRDDEDEDDED